MAKIEPAPGRSGSAEEALNASEADFKPWSAEQAQQWRAANPPLSPWPVVGVQAAVGLMAVAVAAMIGLGLFQWLTAEGGSNRIGGLGARQPHAGTRSGFGGAGCESAGAG